MIYYLTFGQKWKPFRNGWVEVQADNYEDARKKVVEIFDLNWCNLYTEKEFDRTCFHSGKIGDTIT